MTGEELYQSLDQVEDEIVLQSRAVIEDSSFWQKKKRARVWRSALAAAALLAVVVLGGTATRRAGVLSGDMQAQIPDSDGGEEAYTDETQMASGSDNFESELPGISDRGEIEISVENDNGVAKEETENPIPDKGSNTDGNLYSQVNDGDWVDKELRDLLYREYGTGLNIECEDGKTVSIQWNFPAEISSKFEKIYLWQAGKETAREITEEEYVRGEVTITESGHYLLCGTDEEGKVTALNEYAFVCIATSVDGGADPVIPLTQE